MQITHVTHARVAANVPAHQMPLRPHESGVDAFLVDHLRALRRLATTGASPLAVFTQDDARATFQQLRNGDDEVFLRAAARLTAHLVGLWTADPPLVPVVLLAGQVHQHREPPAEALDEHLLLAQQAGVASTG